MPPLVLAMTFGLSMDYEIFLLTRIRERFLHTGQTRDAVAYGVSTSARTITSAALIMIAVFCGFAFAGMPLVAEIGVACAVAIAVDATIVRLILVPALMAMFSQWNWWLPRWLARMLPSVDFDRPLPEVDLADVVVIPDDIAAAIAPSGDLRMVLKSAARFKHLAPESICVADPLAFTGCGRSARGPEHVPELVRDGADVAVPATAPPPRPRVRRLRQDRRPVGGQQGRPGLPQQPRPGDVVGRASGSSGHRVARATRDRPRRSGNRRRRARGREKRHGPAPVRAAQPGRDHQRPIAHRRPSADPDRSGNVAAQGLPDHEP
ncbi:MMPL family protein [Mycobacterium kansasii]|uniref:MMPL family protein n=1 Tax=Mycobacterium kansasii TaxID=1768 RepID=A0A1V3WPN7_MYCKA|nr:MMPL family protein [Mycobacterium kansasii]